MKLVWAGWNGKAGERDLVKDSGSKSWAEWDGKGESKVAKYWGEKKSPDECL